MTLRQESQTSTELCPFPFSEGRSCTGTLALNIEDMNDNAPEIIQDDIVICKPKMGYTDISAVDPDEPIHGPPFQFALASSSPEVNRIWTLNQVNGIPERSQLM